MKWMNKDNSIQLKYKQLFRDGIIAVIERNSIVQYFSYAHEWHQAFIFYSENKTDAEILSKVDKIIHETFKDFKTFRSSIVFKATWSNMAFYSDNSKVYNFFKNLQILFFEIKNDVKWYFQNVYLWKPNFLWVFFYNCLFHFREFHSKHLLFLMANIYLA